VKDDCLDGGFKPLLLIAPPPLDNDDGAAAKTLESVIDNFELASTKYTAEYLFAINFCRSKAKTNLDTVDKSLYTERFNAAKGTMLSWIVVQRRFGKLSVMNTWNDNQLLRTRS
jgi:hypothetical protein